MFYRLNKRELWLVFSTIYFMIVGFLILKTVLLPLAMMIFYSAFCYTKLEIRHWRYFPAIFILVNNCFQTKTVFWLDYRKWIILVLMIMFLLDWVIIKNISINCILRNIYIVIFFAYMYLRDLISGGTYTLLNLIFLALTLMLMMYEMNKQDHFQDFLDMLIIATLCIVLIGFLEFIIQDTFYYKLWTGENRYRNGIMRVGSTVEDPNFICFSIVPILPIMIYKAKTTKKIRYIIFQIIYVLLVLLTQSRIGLLTMLLGYLLGFINEIKEILKKNKALFVGMVFVLIIFSFVIFVTLISNLSLNMSDDSYSGRLFVYLSSLKVVKENFLFGIGMERFASVIEPILLNNYGFYNAIGFQNPMNTWLQILVDGGIIGLLLFIAIIVRNIKLLRRVTTNQNVLYSDFVGWLVIAMIQWTIISLTLDGMTQAILWFLMLIPSFLETTNMRRVE